MSGKRAVAAIPVERRRNVRYRDGDGHAALSASGPSPRSTPARPATGAASRRARRRRRPCPRHAASDGVRLGCARTSGLERARVACSGRCDERGARARGARDGEQPADQAAGCRRRRDGDRVPQRPRRRGRAAAGGTAGQRGIAGPPVAQDRRLLAGDPALVSARRRARDQCPRCRRLARNRRLLPGRRHGGGDLRLRDQRQAVRIADRRATERRAVADRLVDPPSRRRVARRRHRP